jgi:hypothetical protein
MVSAVQNKNPPGCSELLRHSFGNDLLRPSIANRPRFAGHPLEFAIDGAIREKGSMKIKSLNHKGHEGTQRKPDRRPPLCTFVAFVVNGFSSAEQKFTEVQ